MFNLVEKIYALPPKFLQNLLPTFSMVNLLHHRLYGADGDAADQSIARILYWLRSLSVKIRRSRTAVDGTMASGPTLKRVLGN